MINFSPCTIHLLIFKLRLRYTIPLLSEPHTTGLPQLMHASMSIPGVKLNCPFLNQHRAKIYTTVKNGSTVKIYMPPGKNSFPLVKNASELVYWSHHKISQICVNQKNF